MKKGAIVLVFILLFSASLLSAGLWGDLWDSITGRVVEDSDLGGELASLIDGCFDTDGGMNYNVRGYGYDNIKYFKDNPVYDECHPDNTNILREVICREDGYVDNPEYECPNGCRNGACIAEEENTINQTKICDITNIYFRGTDGKRYSSISSDLFIMVDNLEEYEQYEIIGAESWDGLGFKIYSASGNSKSLKSVQSLNPTAVNYINERKYNIKLTYNNEVICEQIGIIPKIKCYDDTDCPPIHHSSCNGNYSIYVRNDYICSNPGSFYSNCFNLGEFLINETFCEGGCKSGACSVNKEEKLNLVFSTEKYIYNFGEIIKLVGGEI